MADDTQINFPDWTDYQKKNGLDPLGMQNSSVNLYQTFLPGISKGRLRLHEKDGPVFTNPRLGPAITFLRDVHLIGGQGLTEYGAEAVTAA